MDFWNLAKNSPASQFVKQGVSVSMLAIVLFMITMLRRLLLHPTTIVLHKQEKGVENSHYGKIVLDVVLLAVSVYGLQLWCARRSSASESGSIVSISDPFCFSYPLVYNRCRSGLLRIHPL